MKLIKTLIIVTVISLVILFLINLFGPNQYETIKPKSVKTPSELSKNDPNLIDISIIMEKQIAIMNTYLDSIPFGNYTTIVNALNLLNKYGVTVYDTSGQNFGTLNEFVLQKDLSSFDVYKLDCSSSDCNNISNVYVVKKDFNQSTSPCNNESDNKKIITDKVALLQGYIQRIVATQDLKDKDVIIEQAINLFADTSFFIEIILDKATQTKQIFKIKDYFSWLKEKSSLGRFSITWAQEIVLSNISKDDSSGLFRGEALVKQYWTSIKKVSPEFVPEDDHTHVTNKRVVFYLRQAPTTNGINGCEVLLGNVYADQIE